MWSYLTCFKRSRPNWDWAFGLHLLCRDERNAKEPIVTPGQFGTCSDQSDVNNQPILDRIWAFWRTSKFPREVMINLPDTVLLNIFRHFLSASEPLQVWPTLTHVCRRWRQIVLTSPLGLHLRLCCTYGTPVLKTLDFWPPFPLIVNYGGSPILDPPAPEDEANIVAAVEQSDRVASITLTLTNSLLEKLSATAGPPSILEELVLLSRDKVQLTLPSALQWGPRLRTLHLTGIAIPTLLQLFSPSRSLVDLQLHEIPNVGYFSPDVFASALSGMTQLETLSLHFLTLPPSRNYPSLPPYPGERVALPALACLKYRGTSRYLDNFVARIDAPRLGDIDITFFNQPTMDASQLGRFIAQIEMWVSLSQVDVQTSAHAISICCSKPGTPTQLKLQISCKQLDWQLSSLTQICKHFSPFLFCVEDLGISSTQSPSERVDIDGEQWLDLIRTFGAAENFRVAGVHVMDILRALCPADGGHAIDPIVLPVLRNLRVQERALKYGPLWNAAQSFITSRQLSCCPVEVHWLYTYSSYPLESILGPNALQVDTSLDTPYWSPTVQISKSTPNLMSIPETYIPACQPIQGSARTHSALQVQVTQVPTTPLFLLPYMVQRSETTHTSILDTTQLTPRYSHYQSPGMSYSPALDILYSLSHSGVSGAAQTWIPHQINQNEGIYEDEEEFRDGDTLTKSLPTRSFFASTTRPSRKQTLEYPVREPQMDTCDYRFPECAAFVRSDVAA
ncbi:hypothetical protein EDB83DRAFT_1541230 [Lactarius deliciosus]|nr:hypothetical protein EDB83DRAFT_1541230 [Lactarius deliciosus]